MTDMQSPTTLAELVLTNERDRGDQIALICAEQRFTYRQLAQLSRRVASALRGRGIAAGDRVAIVASDGLPSIAAMLGCALVGVVFVPINWRLTRGEIANILEDCAPKLGFAEPRLSQLFRCEWVLLPSAADSRTVDDGHNGCTWTSFLEGAQPYAEAFACSTDDVAVQLYTSGTTGQPKGALLAHRSFFAIAQALEAATDRWFGWSESDVNLLFVPTFHIGGLWWLIRSLAVGCCTVVLPRFEPARVLDAIVRHRVTLTGMVPAMMQVLLAEPDCESCDFSSLKTIVYGGSPIAPSLLERARAVFRCNFCQIYGLTETGNCAVTLRPEEHFVAAGRQLLAAGKPFPGVQVRIVAPDGSTAPVGSVGEIWLRSPAAMLGYAQLPDATRAVVEAGWIKTGDGGYVDAEGFVYICDRIKDVIICAGENLYPAQIENAIKTHQDVADVAVIGVPDELWGEVPLAFVVARSGTTISTAELMRHLRGKLADFELPRAVEWSGSLPRTASGKVAKPQLREPYWRDRPRRVN
jgi:acyl-CoA synthetase (AMP-forming)/AMP-acid ligase II